MKGETGLSFSLIIKIVFSMSGVILSRFSRLVIGAGVAALLAFGSHIVPFSPQVSPAHAVAAGTCSEASGTMTCNVSGETLDFSRIAATGTERVATSVFVYGSVKVDARVTIDESINASLSGTANGVSASIGSNATMAFSVDFFDESGAVVLLQNVEILVTDIDGGSQNERAEFSGIASYTLSSDTSLNVVPSGIPDAESETGTRVFEGTRTDGEARVRNVSVLFEEVSSIGLKAFSTGTGGVVGFRFGPTNWGVGITTNTTPVGSGTFTITYDLNLGEPGESLPAPTTGAGNLTLAMGAGLSKGGINISSWNTAADGTGVRFPLGSTYRPISNVTLFAQYETQRVTFDSNTADGGDMSPQDAAGPTALALNAFTKSGHRFTGWNTAADGSGTPYADGGIFPFSANRTLYAQWTRELICTALTSFDEDDFRVIGDASVSGNRVTLTPNLGGQAGGFWSLGRVNLNSDFCVSAEVYLGNEDAGADGLALVLQSVNSASLAQGGGLGYAGLSPSFAVEIDTFYNAGGDNGDPVADHIALMKDGNASIHNSWGIGPEALSYNIEDGKWRLLTFEWDASAKTSTVYLDGTRKFDSVSMDLVDYFSASNGTAFWGFTAATGGAMNLQEVRNVLYSATVRANASPQFVNPPSNRTILRDSENEIVIGLSDDSTEENQWTLGIQVSEATIFAEMPTFVVTSATSATLTLRGHPTELGFSEVTLLATDADGASVTRTFTVTVATTLPATPAPVTTPPRPTSAPVPPPAVQTPVTVPGRTTAVAPAPAPAPVTGPVLRGNAVPTAPQQPVARVGTRDIPVTTQVNTPNRLDVRASSVSLGVSVPQTVGGVRQQPGGLTELEVRSGGQTSLQGGGVLPGSSVQVFMPLQGTNAKQVAQIQADATGAFNGDAVFATQRSEPPLPIGRQVLQIVSVDDTGQQVVMEMAVVIAQPPPAPEFDRTIDALPTLQPGSFYGMSAGEPTDLVVRTDRVQGETVIEGGDFSMSVRFGEQEIPAGEDSSEAGATLTFVRDQVATVSGGGFMPGTRADVWLFSDPTLLTSVDIDDNGEFTGDIVVDGRQITVGEHTLQLQGVGTDGYVRAANLGVIVNDGDEPVATADVASSFAWWFWIIGLLALLAVAVIAFWVYRRANAAV